MESMRWSASYLEATSIIESKVANRLNRLGVVSFCGNLKLCSPRTGNCKVLAFFRLLLTNINCSIFEYGYDFEMVTVIDGYRWQIWRYLRVKMKFELWNGDWDGMSCWCPLILCPILVIIVMKCWFVAVFCLNEGELV